MPFLQCISSFEVKDCQEITFIMLNGKVSKEPQRSFHYCSVKRGPLGLFAKLAQQPERISVTLRFLSLCGGLCF